MVWTIRVFNGTAAAMTNVTVTDNVPVQFEVQSATATDGNVSVNGQTVSWNIGTLNPLQTVVITVTTIVRGSGSSALQTANAPALCVPEGLFEISNEACLEGGSCVPAYVACVTELPETGAAPLDNLRLPLLILAALTLVTGGGWLLRRRHINMQV